MTNPAYTASSIPQPRRPSSSHSARPSRLGPGSSPSPSSTSPAVATPPNSPPRTPSRLPRPRQPSHPDNNNSHIVHPHRRTPSSSATFAAALTGPLPPFIEPIVLSQASQSMERRVSGVAGPSHQPTNSTKSAQQAKKPFLPCLQDPHPHALVCTGPSPTAGMNAQAQAQAGLGNGRPQPRIRTASAPQGQNSRGSSVSPRQSSYSSPLFGPGALASGSRSSSSSAATTSHTSPASPAHAHAHQLHPVPKRGPCSRLSRPPIQARSTSEASHMTYTSFDIKPPQTPGVDDDDDGEPRAASWLSSWLGRGRGSGNGNGKASEEDEESEVGGAGPGKTVGTSAMIERGERTPLLAGQRAEREGEGEVLGEPLPKLSRQCLVAEIKCYGFYMLPPLILFVGLVLTVALWAYTRETGNLGGYVSDAYENVATVIGRLRR